MTATLILLNVGVVVFLLYVAFTNGTFKRCPHCGKIGAWRYDKVGPAEEQLDEDQQLTASVQPLRCRSCHQLVTETWSDFDGRTFVKTDEAPNMRIDGTLKG